MSGFGFASLSGFTALLSLAVVGVIYLFYQRYREQVVTAFFLWDAEELATRGGRKRQRPPITRSLLFDLLSALLLSLAIAAPYWSALVQRAPVILLDDSLSMQSRQNPIRVREDALRVLDDHGKDTGAWVIAAGKTPRMLATPDDGADAARTAVQNYHPLSPAMDLYAAFSLVRQVSPDSADIHLFTDLDFSSDNAKNGIEEMPDVVVHTVAGRGGNLAFVSAFRCWDERGLSENISLTVANFSERQASVTVHVEALPSFDQKTNGESSVLLEQSLTVEKGQKQDISFVLPMGTGAICAEIVSDDEEDVLAADSVVCLVPEPIARLRARVQLNDADANAAVCRALRAAYIELAADELKNESTESDSLSLVALAPVDLIVTDQPVASIRSAARFTLRFLPMPEKPVFLTGPYVTDLAHPLLRDVDFEGIVWPCAEKQEGFTDAMPLVQCGDIPLIGWMKDKSLGVNIVLAKGNLHRSAAWPVFFHRVATLLREQQPGVKQTNFLAGQALVWKSDSLRKTEPVPHALRFVYSACDIQDLSIPASENDLNLQENASMLVHAMPFHAGVYTLSFADTTAAELNGKMDENEETLLAVQAISPAESDLRICSATKSRGRGNDVEDDLSKDRRVWLSCLFAALALLSAFVNWWLDKREGGA